MLANIFLPIFLFGLLVFIHELGHFLVAKYSGVYVERFALGFGPAIFKKKWGETEYALCLLPLGGYVKMLGEEDEMDALQGEDGVQLAKDDPRSYANKSVWTRIAIASMGPIANLILPIVVFSIMFWIGAKAPTSTIGSTLPGFPADLAGLKAGDKVTSVQGYQVQSWDELVRQVRNRGGEPTEITFVRNGEPQTLTITPISKDTQNIYGETSQAGQIGIDLFPYLPVVGINYPSFPAAQAGLQTGDVIKSINGQDINYWWEVDAYFAANTPKAFELIVERPIGDKMESRTLNFSGSFSTSHDAGFERGDLYIREVQEGSIASEKGLKANDRIVSLNGVTMDSWSVFRNAISGNDGSKIDLGIVRDGKEMTLSLTPKEVTHKDEITKEKRKQRQLGVVSYGRPGQPELFTEQYKNPFKAIYRGVQETIDLSILTLKGLGKLFTGQLSLNSMGGPISIFYLAGTSYKRGGWASFFRMLAMLSITLAVLNLLPIPVLDGGHLLFFFIEAIKGSPVSERVIRFGHQVGLVFILGLMAITFYVDINRFFVDKVKALFQ